MEQIGEIQAVNEPRIVSEINGSYNLTFEFSYLDRDKVNNRVLVLADGQYFIVSRVNKFRNDSLTFSAFCEHISYLLIGTYEFTEDDLLEGNALDLLNQTVRNTRFTIRGAFGTQSELYNSETDNIRERIIELADLFRGELIFDNFEIELVERLGNFNSQTIQLGTNLLGVSEEIDYINSERSYEVDLVDLARLNGYEATEQINLGDTVRIVDEQLAINAYERVISIDYNPFQKSLPAITVGTYVRTFTEYVEEEEEEEQEDLNIRDTLLNRFYVGEINARSNLSDELDTVADYLTGTIPFPVASGGITAVVKNNLEGLDIQLTEAAEPYNKYIIHTTRENNRSVVNVVNFNDFQTSNLRTKTYPEFDTESIILLISDFTIEQLREPFTLLAAQVYTFGITITVDDSSRAGDYLYRFDIGENNVLGQLSNEFINVRDYINGVNNYVIPTAKFRLPKLDEELQTNELRFETLRGLFVELLEEVALRNYNFTFINTSLSEEGVLTTEEYPWSEANGSQSINRLISRAFSEGFTFVVHERPLADYATNPRLYFSTVFEAFGIEVIKDISDDDALSLFKRFEIGNVDLINSLSNEMDNVTRRFSTNGVFAIPENEFTITQRQVGLFVEQQVTNVGGYLTLIDQGINGDIVVNGNITTYGPDSQLIDYTGNFEKRGIIIISSSIPFDELTGANLLENLRGAFGVTIVLDERGPQASDYFDEFRIGDRDVLGEVSFVNQAVINNVADSNTYVIPDATLNVNERLQGLFIRVKEEYRNDSLFNLFFYRSTSTDILPYGEFLQNEPFPVGDETSQAINAVISRIPYTDLTPENVEENLIAAFGIVLNLEGAQPVDESPYFQEVGVSNLATDLAFVLANGPYADFQSITYSLLNFKTGEDSTNQYNVRCYPYFDDRISGYTQIRVISDIEDPEILVNVKGIFYKNQSPPE